MILERLNELAAQAEEDILKRVCQTLKLPQEDDDIEVKVKLLYDSFRLLAVCKHCKGEFEIAELPYYNEESWAALVSKQASVFAERFNRHLASHVARRFITER